MQTSKLGHRKTHEPTFYADKFNINPSHVEVSFEGSGVSIKSSARFQEMYAHLLPVKDALSHPNSVVSKDEKNLGGTVVTSNTVYFSQNDYANLGWTLEAVDLNNDRFDDLIVGAPVYSNSRTYQDGAVFIVLANSTTGGVPLVSQNIETSADIVLHPPTGVTRSRFGHSVVALDLNQDGNVDLVVSAPSYGLQDLEYEGRLFIYLGDGSMSFSQPSAIVTCQNVRTLLPENLSVSLSINNDIFIQ